MAELGQGFYPYQALIDGYGNGGFRFAEMSHRGSLLCLPTGMHAWEARSAAEITRANLQPVFDAALARCQADAGWRTAVMEGCGHDPMIDDPEALAVLLENLA